MSKRIKDFVHGYITIPKVFTKSIVDTPNFQRLRRIEQTSMRALFPSARHDRFIHSLGTFHLGSIAIENIVKNSSIDVISEHEVSFKLACLLHDCGHAPFSHTFENYFNPKNILRDKLKEITPSDFHVDLDCAVPAKPHEYLSAIVSIIIYGDRIKALGGDPILVARMITGIEYSGKDIRNPLIGLLNGRAIDVDKLDYSIRDLAISGIKHIQIDVDRLLSSMLIIEKEDDYRLCFKKNALSAINSVINVKNFLSQWVFSHHIVQYDQYLLKKCVKEIALHLSPCESEDNALNILFNPDTYLSNSSTETLKIPMLCDDDLVYLIKKYNLSHATEWLYRQYQMRPVWKTYTEFYKLFKRNITMSETQIMNIIKRTILNENDFVLIMQKEEHLVIEYSQLFIDMAEHGICSATDLGLHDSPACKSFFYLFVNKNLPFEQISNTITHLRRSLS